MTRRSASSESSKPKPPTSGGASVKSKASKCWSTPYAELTENARESNRGKQVGDSDEILDSSPLPLSCRSLPPRRRSRSIPSRGHLELQRGHTATAPPNRPIPAPGRADPSIVTSDESRREGRGDGVVAEEQHKRQTVRCAALSSRNPCAETAATASVPPAALRTSPATPSRHDPGAVGKRHFVEPVADNNSRQCHSGRARETPAAACGKFVFTAARELSWSISWAKPCRAARSLLGRPSGRRRLLRRRRRQLRWEGKRSPAITSRKELRLVIEAFIGFNARPIAQMV
jgi:hypothetical protein